LLACLGATSCAYSASVSVGPTVDTFGSIGVDAKLSVGVGPGPPVGIAAAGIGGGIVGREHAPALLVAPELAAWYEPAGPPRAPALRGAVFFSNRVFWSGSDERRLQGLGASFGLYDTLAERELAGSPTQRHEHVRVGTTVGGEYVWGHGAPDGVRVARRDDW